MIFSYILSAESSNHPKRPRGPKGRVPFAVLEARSRMIALLSHRWGIKNRNLGDLGTGFQLFLCILCLNSLVLSSNFICKYVYLQIKLCNCPKDY